MTELFERPRLIRPAVAVRESFLSGERADCLAEGRSTESLDAAADDFEGYVRRRRDGEIRWGVPCTTFWYVSGEHYLGALIIRHRLTPELAEVGGHVRRPSGRMAAEGAVQCGVSGRRVGAGRRTRCPPGRP